MNGHSAMSSTMVNSLQGDYSRGVHIAPPVQGISRFNFGPGTIRQATYATPNAPGAPLPQTRATIGSNLDFGDGSSSLSQLDRS